LKSFIVQESLPNSHAWESAVAGIGRDAQIAASVQVSLLDDGVVNTFGSVSATRSVRTSVSINASGSKPISSRLIGFGNTGRVDIG
jgi:hypothetical protein